MKKIIQHIKKQILLIFKCRFYLFKKIYCYQPFIYIDNNGVVLKNGIGNRVKWIDNEFIIKSYCSDIAFEIAKTKVMKKYKGDLTDIHFF